MLTDVLRSRGGLRQVVALRLFHLGSDGARIEAGGRRDAGDPSRRSQRHLVRHLTHVEHPQRRLGNALQQLRRPVRTHPRGLVAERVVLPAVEELGDVGIRVEALGQRVDAG